MPLLELLPLSDGYQEEKVSEICIKRSTVSCYTFCFWFSYKHLSLSVMLFAGIICTDYKLQSLGVLFVISLTASSLCLAASCVSLKAQHCHIHISDKV